MSNGHFEPHQIEYFREIFKRIIFKYETWQITNHSNDLGGLTIAGLAYKFQDKKTQTQLDEVLHVSGGVGKLVDERYADLIVDLYIKNYTRPWFKNFPALLWPSMCSIIVHCGEDDLVKIIQITANDSEDIALIEDGAWGKNTASAVEEIFSSSYKGNDFIRMWAKSAAQVYADKVKKQPHFTKGFFVRLCSDFAPVAYDY